MQPSDLYPWGEQLDASSRARALATIGVWIASVGAPDLASFLRVARDQRAPHLAKRISGERRVAWDIRPLLGASVEERAELERIQSAGVLSDLWKVAVLDRQLPIRLEIRSDWDQLDRYAWTVGQLSRPELRASPFIAAKLTAQRANWQWPVRMGILAGARSDALYDTLSPVVREDELVEWVEVDGPHTPCDVLILETRAAAPLEPLAPHLDDLDVGCVLAFAGGVSRANLNPDTDLRGFLLRHRVMAWGVALMDLSAGRAGPFLHELVREMSHDATLDVALAAATRSEPHPVSPPILFAVPRALDEAHVTEYAGRLVDMLATANGGGPQMPAEVRGRLPLPPNKPVEHVVLREAIANRGNFRFEDWGATTVARAARVTRSRAAESAAPARPRRIQAEVFGRDPTAPRGRGKYTESVSGGLTADSDYELEVSIRYPREGAVQADAVIDLSSLPQDRRAHRLDVAFQELGGTEPAQRGRIIIRADEESSATRFSFQTRTGALRARIIVSYRNRILQMVRFEADVLVDAQRPNRRGAKHRPQRLRVESNARASMSDLSHRRTFDFAMVANHADGDPVLGLLKKGDYQQFGAGDISAELKWLEDTLTRLATQVGPLTSKRNQVLLRDLAIRGRRIFNHINSWNRGRKRLQPRHGRIQIVDGSPDAFFPIEFVYDRPMPSNDATLCPKAKQALRDGACPADCPPAGRESEVICPLGFWGLSLVIERHAFMPGRVDKDIVALLAEPATGRNTLRPFGGAAYAASDRADAVKKGSIKLVADAIARAVGRPTKVLGTWKDWTRSVETDAPPLLVLICHTDEEQRAGQPAVQIEIGATNLRKPEWLDVDAVDSAYVVGPAGTPNPVVMLIGCSTALQRVQFSNAVVRFLDNQAAIVLSTLATILGEHAAITTARLIDHMADMPPRRQATFGDVLLRVRQQLLADDVTMALALVAFGDADWRLARA